MKKVLFLCSMLFCINVAFSAPKEPISIMCDLDRMPTEQQKVECPKMIEKVLNRMGCGGKVSKCTLTSPGAPTSGVVCDVVSSKCVEPKVLESNYWKPICKSGASDKYFRDFDDQAGQGGGPLHLEHIYDMGVNIEFVCL